MWTSLRQTVAVLLMIAACFFIVVLASTGALARPQMERLDTDVASVIRADYSADPRGTSLAPLSESIVEEVRRDETKLERTTSEIEFVPVFHLPTSTPTDEGAQPSPPVTSTATPVQRTATPPPDTPESSPTQPRGTPAPWSPTATPVPPHTRTPTPAPSPTATSTPTPWPTVSPTPLPTPAPTASPMPTPTTSPSPAPTASPTPTPLPTPVPTASPVPTPTASPTPTPTASPTPTPTPSATPTPTPSATPTPTPTPTPAPTPLPPIDATFYLHNNPTPPTGDTASQPVLSMDSILPTAATLYNYDTDRDGSPGLVIARGGNGPDEDDPTKYQVWRTPVSSVDVPIYGDVTVKLWSGMKNFDDTKAGAVTVYLRGFDGSDYVELGSDTVANATWQGSSSSWVLETFQFSIAAHTLAPGHSLELKVIVEGSSDDDMWFAYDAASYRSRVSITN